MRLGHCVRLRGGGNGKVERDTFAFKLIQSGTKPYWSTNSADGRYCFVSWSGDDKISAISYKSKTEVAQIPVGDHPQRMRIGNVTKTWLAARQ